MGRWMGVTGERGVCLTLASHLIATPVAKKGDAATTSARDARPHSFHARLGDSRKRA